MIGVIVEWWYWRRAFGSAAREVSVLGTRRQRVGRAEARTRSATGGSFTVYYYNGVEYLLTHRYFNWYYGNPKFRRITSSDTDSYYFSGRARCSVVGQGLRARSITDVPYFLKCKYKL